MQLHEVPAGSRAALRAEVAIVGAGPAGIVLALELADAGHRVLLIDSGGESLNAEAQQLGETVGEDPFHVSMSLATRRQLGGASNLWGGRCVPFDPIDFQPRALLDDARWPVGYEEVARHFQRACDWCRCGGAVFDARQAAELARRSLVPGFVDGEVLASALERWSLPTNFRRVYLKRLRRSPNVTLATGLTCVEVVCDEGGDRVSHLRTRRTDGGGEVEVHAQRYVLACGGLETTRLLFASNRRHPEGLGNHSGHLGRWYMAHVEARIARVRFDTPAAETIYGHERDADGVYVRRRFTFSPEAIVGERLPNAAMWLVNPDIADPSHRNGVLSFAYLALASRLGSRFVAEGIRLAHVKPDRPAERRRHLANMGRDLVPAARFALTFGYRRYLKRGRKVPGFFVPSAANVYPLLYHGEHLPHYESRVLPTDERDALGVPRLRTRLHFSGDDVEGVLRAHRKLDEQLRAQGLGEVEYAYRDPEAAIIAQLFGGYHQAGTTRMSAHPQDGVVDPTLAVHGFEDLFVASSSTFVTSGQANSTFTIVAFAVRLADHLKRELTASGSLSEHARARAQGSIQQYA